MSGIPISKAIRAGLRRTRERRGLSQHDLAAILKVTNVHICNLERGHTAPSLDILRAWCKSLGYEVKITIQPTMKSIINNLG